jgi:hypothetical protein
MNRIQCILAGMAAATLLTAGAAQAGEKFVNGDFETGDFTGWLRTNQAGGSGNSYIQTNGGPTGFNGDPTPFNPTGGNFNAGTDQGGPGSHSLSQIFFAHPGKSYVLSFDEYAHDQSGKAPVGDGTDFTVDPNQHVQVTLSGPNNALLSYGAGDEDWTHRSIDLSSLITVEGTYTVRFTEVDNQLFYNAGLDNVSLLTDAVPEAGTWALMIVGLAGAGAALRSRKVRPATA